MDQLPQDLVNYIILPYLHAMELAEHSEKMKKTFDIINRMRTDECESINQIFYDGIELYNNRSIRRIHSLEFCDGKCEEKYCQGNTTCGLIEICICGNSPYYHYNDLHWIENTTNKTISVTHCPICLD